MKQFYAVTLALCAASNFAYAQQTVTSEKTEVKTNAAGTATKTTTKVSTTEYVDHMRTVYTSAGIPQTKTERLIQLDRQLFEAYRAGDVEAVRRIRLEIRALLGKDITKVHTYINAHPLPGTYPDFIVNTYAPEAAFTRDITISGSGVNVNRTGTAGTVSGSTSVNTTGQTGTGANVSGSVGTSTQGTGTGAATQGTGSTGTGSTGATGSTGSSGSTGGTSSGSTGGTGTTGGSSSGNSGSTNQ